MSGAHLLIVAGGGTEAARRHAAAGGRVIAWSAAAEQALARDGIAHEPLGAHVDGAARDAIDEAAMAWTRAWGRRPLKDGRSFRDLLDWNGVSLWWLAELYLHHSTAAPRHVRTIEAFDRLLEATEASEVNAQGLGAEERLLLARTCTARGVLCHVDAGAVRRSVAGVSLRSRWNTLKTVLTGVKAAFTTARVAPAAHPRVLFLSHAAFWRTRTNPTTGEEGEYEHYFDRLIPETANEGDLDVAILGVGPRTAFRRRGHRARLKDWMRLGGAKAPYVHVNAFVTREVVARTWRATGAIRAVWRTLHGSPGVREAFSHRGVAFADLAEPDLAATLLLQLPWAVRTAEEMAAAFAAFRPAAVCLYAESSGLGRCAIMAARQAGIPTVAIQHGILYPKYYSYRHDPDEGDCPRPDTTAVFGAAAVRFLVEQGRYAPSSLVVTGSPKFDLLLEKAREQDRGAVRASLGVGEGDRLLLVASRFRSIRDTHEALGDAFCGLVKAVDAMPGVHLVVKPHPAEPADAYESVVRATGSARVKVLPPSADLVSLLPSADALVTVESLSAVEALVLGLPLVILNMPTNLRELVDQGVALGVAVGEDPTTAVSQALLDDVARARLQAARARYLDDVAHGVDGLATRRMLDVLRRAAGVPEAPDAAQSRGKVQP